MRQSAEVDGRTVCEFIQLARAHQTADFTLLSASENSLALRLQASKLEHHSVHVRETSVQLTRALLALPAGWLAEWLNGRGWRIFFVVKSHKKRSTCRSTLTFSSRYLLCCVGPCSARQGVLWWFSMTAMLMKVLAVRAAEVTYPTGDRSFAVLQCFPAAFPPEESDPYVCMTPPPH